MNNPNCYYKRIKRHFYLAALSILVQVSTASAQDVKQIYVATTGSERALGTEADPVNSIKKALEIAQSSVSGAKSIQIILRGGTYYIEKTVGIAQDKNWSSAVPLSIEGYKNEQVVLHGGKTIPASQIRPVADKSFYNRFQKEVRDKIRQIDLNEVNVNPGKLRPVGFGRPFGPSWMELFINGKPGQIARWPNKGTVPIDSVINSGNPDPKKLNATSPVATQNAAGDNKPAPLGKPVIAIKPVDTVKKADTTKTPKPGVFFYNDPRPSKWKEPQKAWLSGFFMWGYADDAIPIGKIDTIRRIITTAMGTKYGFGTGKTFRAYYAYNIPEEIDVPGEYYIDSLKNILYFLPPSPLNTVELSVLEEPLMELTGVKNVTVKNIRFTCSRGMGIYMEKTEGVRIDACKFDNLGMMAVFMGKGMIPSKDEVAATSIARVAGDIMTYIYENTTFDSDGGVNNGILNCVVANTGAGGIYISGGNRKTLTPAHNFVKNCLIHDYNRIEKTYRPGIYISGVGNSISHCELYNSPSVAILLHGNNHLIEYNEIHHTTIEVDDMGAIYYGRDPSERGNIVRYNYFHNIGGLNKTMAIYHDDGACGMQVVGNVFFRAGTVAGFIGGGQDNQYLYNVILNTPHAVHIDRRLANWAKGVMQNKGLFQKRLEAVNYLQPPYSTAYPTLKEYFTQGPAAPQRNRFFMNVMVNLDRAVEGDTSLIYIDKRNFETIGDPGFKNYPKMDFRIKRHAIIYDELPGFIAPPIEKMGYRKEY